MFPLRYKVPAAAAAPSKANAAAAQPPAANSTPSKPRPVSSASRADSLCATIVDKPGNNKKNHNQWTNRRSHNGVPDLWSECGLSYVILWLINTSLHCLFFSLYLTQHCMTLTQPSLIIYHFSRVFLESYWFSFYYNIFYKNSNFSAPKSIYISYYIRQTKIVSFDLFIYFYYIKVQKAIYKHIV